jgi:hypothetical protein
MQVKGTWIMNYIKIIRADKDREWDQYLEPEDWEIINGRVLSSQWYSYESFSRIGLAVFKEAAGSDLGAVRAFGRLMLEDLVKVYKTILIQGDPHGSVQKFVALRETFFKDVEGYTRIIDQGSDWLDYKLMMVERDLKLEAAEAFATQMAGSLEALVEKTGAKNVKVDIKREDDGFLIRLKWE